MASFDAVQIAKTTFFTFQQSRLGPQFAEIVKSNQQQFKMAESFCEIAFADTRAKKSLYDNSQRSTRIPRIPHILRGREKSSWPRP